MQNLIAIKTLLRLGVRPVGFIHAGPSDLLLLSLNVTTTFNRQLPGWAASTEPI